MERTKKLYLLAGILLVLSVVTFAVSSCEEKKEEIKTSGEAIIEIDSDTVTAVSWEYGGISLDFRKEDTWKYTADENFPVNEKSLKDVLHVFQSFRASFVIENAEDLGQYDLDDPLYEIYLETEEETYNIHVGGFSSMDSQRYVSIGDGNVYLVTEDPMDYFDVGLGNLILHDDIPYFEDIKEIQFEGASDYSIIYDDELAVSWIEEDVYFTEVNGNLKGLDTSEVEGFLDTLSYLNLTDYVMYDALSDDLPEYGLDQPELKVSVVYDDGEGIGDDTLILSISRDPEDIKKSEKAEEDGEELDEYTVYARVNDSAIVYEITMSEYRELMECSYNHLRHQEILPVNFDDVKALDITLDGSQYSFTSKEKNEQRTWYYEEEEIEINDFELALNALEASEFTSDGAEGKEEIKLVLHLDMKEEASVTIALYRYDGSLCTAVVDGETTALTDREDVVELVETVNAVILNQYKA